MGYNWPPYACTYVYEYIAFTKQRDALSCVAALGYTACAGPPLRIFKCYLRRYDMKRDTLSCKLMESVVIFSKREALSCNALKHIHTYIYIYVNMYITSIDMYIQLPTSIYLYLYIHLYVYTARRAELRCSFGLQLAPICMHICV